MAGGADAAWPRATRSNGCPRVPSHVVFGWDPVSHGDSVEQAAAHAHVRRDGASQIAREQYRAEYRRPREHVERSREQQDDPERCDDAFRVPEPYRGLYDDRRREQLHDAVDEQKQG